MENPTHNKPLREVLVYDRKTRELQREPVLGDAMLKLAYLTCLRPFCQWILFRHSLASKLLGWYCDTPWSRRNIRKSIEILGIDTSEFRASVASFKTFNEFFTRHLKDDARPCEHSPQILACPADSRLTVIPHLEKDTCIPVKGARFTVAELLQASPEEAATFAGGCMLITRLCPADYHRYHYPADGCELRRWQIDGRLNSVNPMVLALGLQVFTHNQRIVTLLELEHFGTVAFVEVGAFGVGGIEQTHTQRDFSKMDEKGYFKFGGSTLVLVFPPGRVRIDADLIENSRNGYETRVHAGETIGRAESTSD